MTALTRQTREDTTGVTHGLRRRFPSNIQWSKDVFNYTIADAAGASASTTLTIDIAQVAAAAAGQGTVALPAGGELSDIHVNGRDLVIEVRCDPDLSRNSILLHIHGRFREG